MKRLIKKLFKLIFTLLLIGATLIIAFGYGKYKMAINTTPLTDKVAAITEKPSYTPTKDISPDFLQAIVAVEDHRFYEHGAIDIIGLTRATIVNSIKGESVQGGSTLTQQVAKNLYFSNEQSFIRKVAELFVAHHIEETFDKDKILELYVNIIYYGDGNYGIKNASMNYFNKKPINLSYEEATLLAGLPQAPSAYALSKHYDRAKQRQQEVINALTKYRGRLLEK
ncbi:biosynthetic peptidoglycan transglycosylase [Bacillus massiliigorillae]|uniref:biosynthetic peptidoglycan transglycosylase n=1 Tax=Bacillus massiliigorillae TaxID=1243664 RepID=UPI00039D89EF|nr:biosynthetic peptidoglycan transglycosylase [Bacillus massiliigorillae]